MHKEQGQGDLKGAIAGYQKIVQPYPKNRPLAAKALLQMAECHKKLGDTKARKIYERVVHDFPDQSEAASTARARLARQTDAIAILPALF